LAGAGVLRFVTEGEPHLPIGIAEPRILRAALETAARLPNLIVYTIDTLRADHLSCYGASNPTSPNIDHLAQEGFLFERFYAVAPWTRPTTASLLSGFHPTWHGMGRDLPLDPELHTLAESLRDAGYSTWAAVANPNVGAEALGFAQGFDRFCDTHGIGMTLPDPLGAASSKRLQATLTPWIRQHGDEPFLLYLHSIDPHAPYAPPPDALAPFGRDYTGPWRNRDLRRTNFITPEAEINEADRHYISDVYDNEIHYQDTQIAALVELLREQGVLDNTVIAIVSDHGEELREHGEWDHGYRVWEELLHVPFVLWIPEPLQTRWGLSPRAIPATVSQIDFVPGLLELLQVDDPTTRQGRSFLPLLKGTSLPPVPFYAHDYHAWDADEIGAFQRGPHKLIWTLAKDGQETPRLYDLEQDPEERNDLSAELPELVRELQTQRRRWTQRFGRDVPSEPLELDERTRAQLKALGYAGHEQD